MVHKVVIIGSGPAGLTAGVYTARATLSPLIIEGNQPGGQLMTTTDVENWPGNISIQGPQLMMEMRKHAEHYGAHFMGDMVTTVDLSSLPYKLTTQSGKIVETESIVIASGAAHKKLGIPGEKEYWGKGTTTCATCDGPFYKDLDVVIAGAGNTAMTEASFLTRFAKKITIIQILDHITANDPIKEDVLKNPKVKVALSSSITEIRGDGNKVTEVEIEHQETKKRSTLPTSGVFVAIGFKPNTDPFRGQLDMDTFGYLSLTNNTQTSQAGVFAAGDVSDYRYMQAITAAGMGCMAALDCEAYLREKVHKKASH